jgi:hypothetical protein
MGKMEIVPARHRLLYGMPAHITRKGLHDKLLNKEAILKYQISKPQP